MAAPTEIVARKRRSSARLRLVGVGMLLITGAQLLSEFGVRGV
jgi:hypothetical protein